MRKSAFLIALLAASVSVPAIAKDGKIAQRAVESVRVVSGPARLSDAEMDKVTAGVGYIGGLTRGVKVCLGPGGEHGQAPFCE